ncbi:MAG: prephenate dehydrogenase [Candidatus Omnitrophica bacterium]|nr:prephenate dehydrogenase [Candidatus Omnitrophota bacterium]MDE2221505.1 prephenate dehydrogenase [Candidatus Omnitrophota bacterium]
MFNRKELFRRVAIVGVGFMGASLGLAVKKKGLAREVIGVGRHEAALKQAKDLGAIDEWTLDFTKGIIGADLIILATPVNTILDFIEILGKQHRRNCIITDLGSTKSTIVERAEKVLHHSVLFVGSHPLVGSEKKGPAHANAQLYEGGVCVMTPTDKTNRLAREKIRQFWVQLGSNVKLMKPQEHDEVLAYISHLPHLLAFALMKAMPDNFLEYAPQGLKDTTRVAASDPDMWRDIALTNHKPILKALDDTVKILAAMRKAIVGRDAEVLTDILKTAKDKRRRLD